MEDYIEENLGDIGFGNNFLDATPKTWTLKERKKLDFVKMKNSSVLQKALLR